MSKTTYDPVVKFRVAIIFLVCTTIFVAAYFEVSDNVMYYIAGGGLAIAIATFFEPVIRPLRSSLANSQVIVRRRYIYETVILQIRSANHAIRFKTPTTSWGLYSEGLKVFEDTANAIRDAANRGVTVQIIADLWDWEKARFALALIRSGAEVRFAHTTHDYYCIKDEEVLIVMGTEDKAQNVPLLDRSVRRLHDAANLTTKASVVKQHILKFDDEWSRLDEESLHEEINRYLNVKCPRCTCALTIKWIDSKIKLEEASSA